MESGNLSKKRKEVFKPDIVKDYNKHMGYVDLGDRMANSYTFCRKTLKWTKKLFFHLLDLSVVNSYYLFKIQNSKACHKQYRMSLISEILRKMEPKTALLTSPTTKRICRREDVNEHWPLEEKKKRRRCAYCFSKGVEKRTTISCTACNVGLCIGCFKNYHT
jgi:hypothetical protein